MPACAPTPFERMLITGARLLDPQGVYFVGFHWPMLIMRLARRLHAPDAVVVYEDGIVEDRLTPTLPTSPSDLTAAEGAAMCAGSLEALYMWLGAGRVDMALLDAPIVDRRGNVNTTVVGDYEHPRVRLAGSGGGTELASLARALLLVSSSVDRRSYPETVDYITSPGFLGGRGDRDSLGYKPGTGPTWLVNPLGLFAFPDEEVAVAALHPGVAGPDVAAAFAWSVNVPADIERLPEPTAEELSAVRAVLAEARDRSYRLPEHA
jgi:glutaconate CoA-transferase subunit B